MKVEIEDTKEEFKPFSIKLTFETQKDIDEWIYYLPSGYSNVDETKVYEMPINKITQIVKFRK